jgi:acyl carrier protein
MKRSRDEVRADIVLLLRGLADDWEYDGEITEDTRMLADLGFESLDVVVLATVVQDYYHQVLPFPEFFAEIGQRAIGDVTVGEWVTFVCEHLT